MTKTDEIGSNQKTRRDRLSALIDYFAARLPVFLFSAVLYFIAVNQNLQIQAFFTESVGNHGRTIAVFGAALTACAHFLIRRRPVVGLLFWPDLLLHFLPILVIGFWPPWGGQDSWIVWTVLALQIVLMLAIAPQVMQRESWWTDRLLGMTVGTLIVFYILFSVVPVDSPRLFGSVALGAVFLGLTSVLVDVVSRYRILRSMLIVWVIISLLWNEFEHEAQLRPMPLPTEKNWDNPFALWLFNRPNADHYRRHHLPYPVFVVASEGGGGYAMAHAFTFLNKMSEQCPSFGQNLFALVGVSGGQIGNALYHSNAKTSSSSEVSPCINGLPSSHSEYLSTDHLSPLIAHFLFVELPRKLLFLGGTHQGRSHVLLESFNSEMKGYNPIPDIAYDAHFWKSVAIPNGRRFALQDKPALVSVTVDVQSGNRFVFSPFGFITRSEAHFSSNLRHHDASPAQEATFAPSLGSVSLASASFPWVTPSMRFNFGTNNAEAGAYSGLVATRSVNLVDGGYFENTGAETLSEIVATLEAERFVTIRPNQAHRSESRVDQNGGFRSFSDSDECEELKAHSVPHFDYPTEWERCSVPYFMVAILIRSAGAKTETSKPQSFLSDPLEALLNTRSARGNLAVATMLERRCGFSNLDSDCAGINYSARNPYSIPHDGVYQSYIENEAMDLPLGWTMPNDRIEAIENFVLPGEDICSNFSDELGRVDFSTPYQQSAPYPEALDEMVKFNCANRYYLGLFFDPGKYLQDLMLRIQ